MGLFRRKKTTEDTIPSPEPIQETPDESLVPLQESIWKPNQETVAANLVLEGGAMRCQFTAGVLDFFMQKGLLCERVIGTSAGALSGYPYVAGLMGRTCLLNMTFCDDPKYFSMRSFVRTGNALNREYAFDTVPNKLVPFNYQAFNDSPSKLVSVASDLRYGEADYHEFKDGKNDLPYLIASSSMPLISQPVEVDGKVLLDGGTCDSVPLVYSLKTGATKHIVVLTQDETYEKEPNQLMPLIKQRYAEYPLYVERSSSRHLNYNHVYRACKLMHESGEIFLIQPSKPVEVKSMETDADKLFDLYEQGYNAAANSWDDLQRYLEA